MFFLDHEFHDYFLDHELHEFHEFWRSKISAIRKIRG